jgi:hypothetical protein
MLHWQSRFRWLNSPPIRSGAVGSQTVPFNPLQTILGSLGASDDSNDSASMNIWLHKQVMTKLAANGGKLPPEIKALRQSSGLVQEARLRAGLSAVRDRRPSTGNLVALPGVARGFS